MFVCFLQLWFMTPGTLRIHIRDVTAAWMVLLVHCEVHHKVHLVWKIESQAVALFVRGCWSSELHPSLFIDGHLFGQAARGGAHPVKHLSGVVPPEAGTARTKVLVV